jgi:hypothetical protein
MTKSGIIQTSGLKTEKRARFICEQMGKECGRAYAIITHPKRFGFTVLPAEGRQINNAIANGWEVFAAYNTDGQPV